MREPKVALTPPHNAGLEAVIRAIGRLLDQARQSGTYGRTGRPAAWNFWGHGRGLLASGSCRRRPEPGRCQ